MSPPSPFGFFMWQDGGGCGASRWILAVATFCAVLAALWLRVTIGRRPRWRCGRWPCCFRSLADQELLEGHFTTMNLFEIAGTLIGGLSAYYAVPIAPLGALKVED